MYPWRTFFRKRSRAMPATERSSIDVCRMRSFKRLFLDKNAEHWECMVYRNQRRETLHQYLGHGGNFYFRDFRILMLAITYMVNVEQRVGISVLQTSLKWPKFGKRLCLMTSPEAYHACRQVNSRYQGDDCCSIIIIHVPYTIVESPKVTASTCRQEVRGGSLVSDRSMLR